MFKQSLCLVMLLSVASAGRCVDPIPFLPAETDVVITIQSKQVAGSELLKNVGADLMKILLKASPQASDAVEASGVDLLKDFDRVVIGLDAQKTNPFKPFALMEGRFDTKKVTEAVEAYIAKHPGQVTPIKVADKPAYQVKGRADNEVMFTAVISDSLMVLAPTEKALAGAFEAAAGGRKPVISKELAGVIATTKSTAPVFVQAWVKGRFASINLPNEQLKQRLQGVDWVTASANVTKDVTLNAVINTPDAAAAKQLGDLLGGAVLLLKLQAVAAAEDQPEMRPVVELLRSVRVNPKERTVVITGSVKGTEIEKALNPPPVSPAKK